MDKTTFCLIEQGSSHFGLREELRHGFEEEKGEERKKEEEEEKKAKKESFKVRKILTSSIYRYILI